MCFGEFGNDDWLLMLSSEMSALGASGELGVDFCEAFGDRNPFANFMKESLLDFLSLSVDLQSGDFDLESGVVPLPNIPVIA